MLKIENQCVGCPDEMGCIGLSCPHKYVVTPECDKCHDEVDELYEYNVEQLCSDCLLSYFPQVVTEVPEDYIYDRYYDYDYDDERY